MPAAVYSGFCRLLPWFLPVFSTVLQNYFLPWQKPNPVWNIADIIPFKILKVSIKSHLVLPLYNEADTKYFNCSSCAKFLVLIQLLITGLCLIALVLGKYGLHTGCWISTNRWGAMYRNTTLATPAPKIQSAGLCGNINRVDQLRHLRSVAYSAELVLLNKQQIWCGGADLHC